MTQIDVNTQYLCGSEVLKEIIIYPRISSRRFMPSGFFYLVFGSDFEVYIYTKSL